MLFIERCHSTENILTKQKVYSFANEEVEAIKFLLLLEDHKNNPIWPLKNAHV